MQFVPVLTKPVTASGAVAANRFVLATGAQATVAGSSPIGVAREAAASGALFTCDMLGTAIVEAGAAIAKGVAVKTGADGRALTYDTGTKAGVALQAATAAGQMIEILLIPSA